jgi:hypothetical protein
MLANADEGLSAVPQTYPIKEVSQVKIIQSILLRSNTPIISELRGIFFLAFLNGVLDLPMPRNA